MSEAGGDERRFLPRRAPIDAYGAGGFRFADMSHRGALLALPSGMHAWAVVDATSLSEVDLAPVFAEASEFELLLLGTGRDLVPVSESLRWQLRDHRIALDVMPTAPAIRTWNVLLAEDRRVAAALIPVP